METSVETLFQWFFGYLYVLIMWCLSYIIPYLDTLKAFFLETPPHVLAIEFLVILLWVQRGKPFVGGREFDFLIFAALLTLLVLGPGAFAFDLPL